MNLHRELLLGGLAALVVLGSVGLMPVDHSSESPEYTVTVRGGPGGGEPGVPVVIRVRTRSGKVVVESKTDSSGVARFHLASGDAPSRPSLEALLDLGGGRTVGVIETLNRECRAYELYLPTFEVMQCHGTIVE